MFNPPAHEQIEAALGERQYRLRFPNDLEKRFEADTGTQRSQMLFISGLICLLIYDSFLITDYLMRPAQFWGIAALRLGLVTGLGLLTLYWIRRGLPCVYREGSLALIIVLGMGTSGLIFSTSPLPIAMFDPFSFSLILLAGNIVVALRFKFALLSTLACLLVMALYVIPNRLIPLEAKTFALLITLGTAVFTLFANYRLEVSERNTYLLLLRERLRASLMHESNQVLTHISQTDSLTQLPNRRRFDEVYQRLWQEAAKRARHIGVLMIDIDHFKRYNDYYGHQQGDICLATVAAAIESQRRAQDLVARLGGEEFAVLLTDTDLDTAVQIAERIRSAIEVLGLDHGASGERSIVTVSIGVALTVPTPQTNPAWLMRQADEALYAAKGSGRNCIQVAATSG